MRPRPPRPFAGAVAMSFAVLALTARAWAGAAAPVTVRGLDASGYPTVRFAVVTATPSREAPSVLEDGGPVSAGASNLASDTNVVLAIDRSRSMEGASLASASEAAAAFVAEKPASDRIGIVSFGHTATPLTSDFSTSTIDAEGALRSIQVDAVQGTALYDAVVLSARQLARQGTGGRVIVLLTDGQDVSSKASLDQAVTAAHDAGAEVYPIAIAGPGYTPEPLRQLAAATGGEMLTAASAGDLHRVYAAIAAKLARTWQVQYVTSARPGDHLQLGVRVAAEGEASAALAIPSSAGAPPTVAPPTLLPSAAYRSPVTTVVVSLAAVLLLALALLALRAARKASWVRARLDPHVDAIRRRGRRPRRTGTGTTVGAILRATERVFGNLRQWRSLRRLLERADVPLRPAEFAWIAFGSACLGAIVVGLASGSGAGAFAGLLLGAAVPWTTLWYKARRRLTAFENQLPDLLITLAASLKAGHSFRQGIQTVVEEGQPPAAAEFKRVLTDAQLGRPLEDALQEMAERVGSKNFDFVITAVAIQRQVGGSLAGLFDMVADTVRQRQQFARRIKSLTAMGRMSAYVLVCLPFFLAVVMTLMNRTYMKPLLDTSAGHLMIAAAFVMMTLGSLILKKIVSFRG